MSGEELVAGWFGWANRTLESTAEPRQIPRGWHMYAYRGYMALKRLDDAVLERALPPAIFYNLLISARAPDGEPAALRADRRLRRQPRPGRRSIASRARLARSTIGSG